MRIYDLSGHPSFPCYLIKHGGAIIMLDCGLDISSALCYLPVSIMPNENKKDSKNLPKFIKEIEGVHFIDDEPKFITPEMNFLNMSYVDVVLISNFNCAFALPFVTGYTQFKGVIFATEPTLSFTKLLMEELVANVRKVPRSESASTSLEESTSVKSMRDPEIMELFSSRIVDPNSLKDWRRLYDDLDVKKCLSKFQVIGLNEIKEIPGGLKIQSLSSGFGIGSCNWLISSAYHKFGYVSCSSVLMTHSKPMETAPLKSCDVLILSCLSQRPLSNPDTHVKEFCTTASMTLKNGGNVLVPCCTVGALYDLIECLHKHLESTGLGGTPLYCLSPVANSSLAYSCIYSEWLSPNKQAKVFQPESPFPHAELVRGKRLQTYPSAHEGFSKEASHPCVVFTSHVSLRFGDVVHLVKTWNTSKLNCVIITDPSLNHADVLAPFKPLVMGVYHCPIDTGMSFYEVNNFLREVSPKNLVVPEKYITSSKPGTSIDPEFNAITTRRLEVKKISIKKMFRKVAMTPELGNSLTPTELRPGVGVAMLAGSLSCWDFKYTLKPIRLQRNGKKAKIVKPQLAYGKLDVSDLVGRLKQKNFSVRVDDQGNGNFLIELPDDDAVIKIENRSSHVVSSKEKTRIIIRDTLLECLSKL